MQMLGNKDSYQYGIHLLWQHLVLYVSKHMHEHNHFNYDHAVSEGSMKGVIE